MPCPAHKQRLSTNPKLSYMPTPQQISACKVCNNPPPMNRTLAKISDSIINSNMNSNSLMIPKKSMKSIVSATIITEADTTLNNAKRAATADLFAKIKH